MLYRQLKNHKIHLTGKETTEYDAGSGVIMIPDPNSKIFVHWLSDKGAVRSTFTMTYDTEIRDRVKLINGLSSPVNIHVIKLS